VQVRADCCDDDIYNEQQPLLLMQYNIHTYIHTYTQTHNIYCTHYIYYTHYTHYTPTYTHTHIHTCSMLWNTSLLALRPTVRTIHSTPGDSRW